MSEELHLTVPCPLCKMPAGSDCVSTVDGTSREQPHPSRPARARIVASAIAENLAIEEQM